MARKFQVFVAWRYLLASPRKASKPLLITMIVFGLLCVGCIIASVLDESSFQWKTLAMGLGAIFVLTSILFVVRYYFVFFSMIPVGGIALGCMALVIVLGIMNGFEKDLQGKILGFNAHLRITKEDFDDYREVGHAIKQLEGVKHQTPYLTSEMILSSKSNYHSVIIKGVSLDLLPDVLHLSESRKDNEKKWNQLKQKHNLIVEHNGPLDLSQGSTTTPSPNDLNQAFESDDAKRKKRLDYILIGQELQHVLGLYPDMEILLISPWEKEMTPVGTFLPKTRSMVISDVFYTGMYEYDLKFVFADIQTLQTILLSEDKVEGIEVYINDLSDLDAVKTAMINQLGNDYVVKDWRELNQGLFSALQLEKIAMFIVLASVILVASFSIFSNLVMVVTKKRKDISLFKILGATDRLIRQLFIIQGTLIGLLGTCIGVCFGLLGCFIGKNFGFPLNPDVYYIDRLPITIEPQAVLMVTAASIIISIVATLYPAMLSLKIKPIDGLKG